MAFDPYDQWLEVTTDRRPPDPYELLGLSEDDADRERIHEAGAERYERIRRYATSPDKEVANHAHRIMAEISQAIVTLTNRHVSQAEEQTREESLTTTVADEPFSPAAAPSDLPKNAPPDLPPPDPAAASDEPQAGEIPEAEVPAGEQEQPSEAPEAEIISEKQRPKRRGRRRGLSVWAIDAGNCSLKAIRCHEESGRMVIDVADRVDYPKLLNQPGAEPAQLLADALSKFVSRHIFRDERVVISIPGQQCMTRFVKLLAVEPAKIGGLAAFEARKQIPFPLEKVFWRYHWMPPKRIVAGLAVDVEIGLFAIKLTLLDELLEPFFAAGLDVDHVQIAPMSVYNFFVFDSLAESPLTDDFNPEEPPPSDVILSMGTDSTDLVITNRYRCWQRTIPLGGNHFTQALCKELKLTFDKAEHLKRNATTAQDPAALFQAMRPVYDSLLEEIRRSVGFYTSLERNAKIDRLVVLGGPARLAGLRKYLALGLDYEPVALESLDKLVEGESLRLQLFRDNPEAFALCCGLALDGLKQATVGINLLPPEIRKKRKRARVRRKIQTALQAAARTAARAAVWTAVATVTYLPRKVDRTLRWISGEDNEIIHYFLRFLTVAGLAAVVVFGGIWFRNMATAPPAGAPVAQAEDVQPVETVSSEPSQSETTVSVDDPSTEDVDPVMDAIEALDIPSGGSIAGVARDDRSTRLANSETTTSNTLGAPVIIRRLAKHSDGVTSVAFSADGKKILTGSSDKTAILWDADTGTMISRFVGHDDPVLSVAISPDGTRVLTGSDDGTAILWKSRNGLKLQQLEGHTKSVSSVAFSPNGEILLTGSFDNTVRLWDADTGREIRTLGGHGRAVSSVTFSPDGEDMAIASYDGIARIEPVVPRRSFLHDEPTVLSSSSGHHGPLCSVVFSPDGTQLLTGALDKTAVLWDVDDETVLHRFDGFPGFVTSVAFSPDGTQLLTGCSDKTAILWNAKTYQQVHQLVGHAKQVSSVAFSPDGTQALTGSHDDTAILWQIQPPQ